VNDRRGFGLGDGVEQDDRARVSRDDQALTVGRVDPTLDTEHAEIDGYRVRPWVGKDEMF
jgi:hypothetical protein